LERNAVESPKAKARKAAPRRDVSVKFWPYG
jgi:hypothetical protein